MAVNGGPASNGPASGSPTHGSPTHGSPANDIPANGSPASSGSANGAEADVIVVGAGLAGLVATAELADAGRRVVLLKGAFGE